MGVGSSKEEFSEEQINLFYKENGQINEDMTRKIQSVYYFFGLCWILFIIFYIQIFSNFDTIGIMGMIILCVPLLIFLINLFNAKYITKEMEGQYFGISYLAIALIVIVPFVNMTYYYGVLADKKKNDKPKEIGEDVGDVSYVGRICLDEKRVIEILVIALGLAVLSLMDIWIKPKWALVVKHIRSSLQIISLSLIIYALYIFYQCNLIEKEVKKGGEKKDIQS